MGSGGCGNGKLMQNMQRPNHEMSWKRNFYPSRTNITAENATLAKHRKTASFFAFQKIIFISKLFDFLWTPSNNYHVIIYHTLHLCSNLSFWIALVNISSLNSHNHSVSYCGFNYHNSHPTERVTQLVQSHPVRKWQNSWHLPVPLLVSN